jgi:hypothetical protein
MRTRLKTAASGGEKQAPQGHSRSRLATCAPAWELGGRPLPKDRGVTLVCVGNRGLLKIVRAGPVGALVKLVRREG